MALAITIGMLSGFLAQSSSTRGLDWLYFDNLQQLSHLPPASDIAIIEIDDKSIAQVGRWPWPRKTHAELLDILSYVNSKAVIFDVLFSELDSKTPQSDLRFAEALKKNDKVILPIHIETVGQQGQVIESPPANLFYANARALGHVHIDSEDRGIVRSIFLKEGVGSAFWPHLSLALLAFLKKEPIADSPLIMGVRAANPDLTTDSLGVVKDFYNLLPMPATDQGLVHYSYADILNGTVDAELLREKIIFIGASATGLGDLLATPIGTMTGVELNAWIFHALRNNLLIQSYPKNKLAFLTFVSVLLLTIALGRLSPRVFLTCTLLAISTVLLFSALLLFFGRLWLPPMATIIGLMLFVPLWSWLRAERVLRFLRDQIDELSLQSQPFHEPLGRQNDAIQFLNTIGMITPSTGKSSQNGRNAARTLQLSRTIETESFWKEQISKESNRTKYPIHKKTEGVELIARTISQLEAIKKNDRENRQLIEKSLSQLQDAVCISDLCGRIIFTNKLFQQWFEPVTRQPLQKTLLLDILNTVHLNAAASWTQTLSTMYQTGQQFSGEATLAESDTQLLCQASLISITQTQRDTLILTFTDITPLKAAEKARSDALNFLSHDLRSPLVSVLAILERNQSKAHLPSNTAQSIETLVRKNLDYAEHFLQLSRADSLTEATMVPCDLHAVLDGAQVYATALSSPKSMNIVVDRCYEDAWVLGDLSLLERALNNLISNAVKFSPAATTIKLALVKQESTLLLSVSDQGPGIDEQDLSKLFDRFTRIKRTESTFGAGLGLNFVATVVRRHNGEVLVNSKRHIGSTFTLNLPALTEQNLF